jgi:hypothetical protein
VEFYTADEHSVFRNQEQLVKHALGQGSSVKAGAEVIAEHSMPNQGVEVRSVGRRERLRQVVMVLASGKLAGTVAIPKQPTEILGVCLKILLRHPFKAAN